MALLVIVTAGCADGTPAASDVEPAATPSVTSTVSPTDPLAYATDLIAETNRVRTDQGLPTLAHSACAASAADPRAHALVGAPELEHAPIGDILTSCPPHARAAENLSRASASPSDVVEAWLGSYGHRENLLSPTLTEVGVACVRDDAAMLCSQLFLGP